MMFHSRELNNKINNLHERALRIVSKDNKSTTTKFLGPKITALSELKFNHGHTNCISDEILASILPQFVLRGADSMSRWIQFTPACPFPFARWPTTECDVIFG